MANFDPGQSARDRNVGINEPSEPSFTHDDPTKPKKVTTAERTLNKLRELGHNDSGHDEEVPARASTRSPLRQPPRLSRMHSSNSNVHPGRSATASETFAPGRTPTAPLLSMLARSKRDTGENTSSKTTGPGDNSAGSPSTNSDSDRPRRSGSLLKHTLSMNQSNLDLRLDQDVYARDSPTSPKTGAFPSNSSDEDKQRPWLKQRSFSPTTQTKMQGVSNWNPSSVVADRSLTPEGSEGTRSDLSRGRRRSEGIASPRRQLHSTTSQPTEGSSPKTYSPSKHTESDENENSLSTPGQPLKQHSMPPMLFDTERRKEVMKTPPIRVRSREPARREGDRTDRRDSNASGAPPRSPSSHSRGHEQTSSSEDEDDDDSLAEVEETGVKKKLRHDQSRFEMVAMEVTGGVIQASSALVRIAKNIWPTSATIIANGVTRSLFSVRRLRINAQRRKDMALEFYSRFQSLCDSLASDNKDFQDIARSMSELIEKTVLGQLASVDSGILEKSFFQQFVFQDDMNGMLGGVSDTIQQSTLTILLEAVLETHKRAKVMDTNEGQFSALQELSETATWLDENGFRDPDIRREYKSSGTQTEAAAEAKYAAELKEFGKGDKKFADAVRILQGYNQKLEAKLNREDPKSSEMFHMEDLDLEDLNTVCTWVATKSLTTQFDALKDKIKREGVQKALGQDLVVLENSSSTMIRNLETLKRRRQTSVRKIGRLAPVNEMDGEDTSTDWEQFEAENEIELLKGQVSVLEEVLKSLGKNAREAQWKREREAARRAYKQAEGPAEIYCGIIDIKDYVRVALHKNCKNLNKAVWNVNSGVEVGDVGFFDYKSGTFVKLMNARKNEFGLEDRLHADVREESISFFKTGLEPESSVRGDRRKRSRSYEIGNTLGNKHAGLLLAKEKNNLVITYLKVPSLKSDETQHRLRSWIRANRKDIWQECKRRYTDRLSGVHEEDIEIVGTVLSARRYALAAYNHALNSKIVFTKFDKFEPGMPWGRFEGELGKRSEWHKISRFPRAKPTPESKSKSKGTPSEKAKGKAKVRARDGGQSEDNVYRHRSFNDYETDSEREIPEPHEYGQKNKRRAKSHALSNLSRSASNKTRNAFSQITHRTPVSRGYREGRPRPVLLGLLGDARDRR